MKWYQVEYALLKGGYEERRSSRIYASKVTRAIEQVLRGRQNAVLLGVSW